MKGKKTYFNLEWLLKEEIFWVRSVEKDRTLAACTVCNKTFSLSSMGIQALRSHEEGVRRINNLKAYKVVLTNPMELHVRRASQSTTIPTGECVSRGNKPRGHP